MPNNSSWGILVYNVEKSNEDVLFPLCLCKLSREFDIGSLFWMAQKDLTPEKKNDFCCCNFQFDYIKVSTR